MGTIYDPRYKAVIQKLVALRNEAGLTQRELAERLDGFRQPDIAKVEGLQRRLDVIELVDWLTALGAADVTFPNLGSISTVSGVSEAATSYNLESEFVQIPGSSRGGDFWALQSLSPTGILSIPSCSRMPPWTTTLRLRSKWPG